MAVKTVKFAITQEDYDAVHDMLDHPERDSELKGSVWILTGRVRTHGKPVFTVVDARDSEPYTEDFLTLDGAIMYAVDRKVTTEDQGEWDYTGALADGLDAEGRIVLPKCGYCLGCDTVVNADDDGNCVHCTQKLHGLRDMAAPWDDLDDVKLKAHKRSPDDIIGMIRKLEIRIDKLYEKMVV